MRRNKVAPVSLCLAAGLLLSLGSCAPATPTPSEGAVQATVSILPQKYFVERIGGDRVSVSVVVLPGANPATYEPKPRQVVDLTESKIYFSIGVPFETAWLERFRQAAPRMTIVNTQEGVSLLSMASGHRHEEGGHGDHEGHSAGKDPHIWLSPPLVMIQARHYLTALVQADPEGRALYEANYRKFIAELVELDLKIDRLFSDVKSGRRFMVYHPAWGYFARAYGLIQIPVEMEGKSPPPKVLQRLIEQAKQEGIRVVFVQPQFATKSAETIAQAIQGQVVKADPLAPDWSTNLYQVAEQFRACLK